MKNGDVMEKLWCENEDDTKYDNDEIKGQVEYYDKKRTYNNVSDDNDEYNDEDNHDNNTNSNRNRS